MNQSSLRLATAALAASLALSSPLRALAQPAPAGLQAADKAAKAKDWATALKEYRAANAAQKSAAAEEGIAVALYELKEYGEAYDAYEALLKDFGASLPPPKKKAAEGRLKELGEKTGGLTLKVNEDGAEITVDDRVVGKSPLASPLRLSPGPHRLKVTKEGFLPLEQVPNVNAGAVTPLDVSLAKDARKAHLVVKEASGAEAVVVVDGITLGKTPFEGDVEPGAHQIMLRTSSLASAPQNFELERGKTKELTLDVKSSAGRLEVRVHESQGTIFLDGKEVGQGTFSGDVPAGKHKLEVRREGFEPFVKEITIAERQTDQETVTMSRVAATIAAPDVEEPTYQGIYGGFGLAPAFMAGGTGHELQEHCTDIGAASCDNGSPFGGGAWGYFGYSWNPVGIELMLGGMFDQTQPSAEFSGFSSDPRANPRDTGVARSESFKFLRAGGFGAIRARMQLQTTGFRFSLAAGVGLSYKKMFMERDTVTKDGAATDIWAPEGKKAYPCDNGNYCDDYVSPALSIDVSGAWRIGRPTSLVVGLFLWLENAGSRVQVRREDRSLLSPTQGVIPLATRDYHLATSTQVYLGPYIGMQFGP